MIISWSFFRRYTDSKRFRSSLLMFVLCDGMLRSGSTWSFNVTVELLRSCDPATKTFGLYSEDPAVLRAATKPRKSHLVIKSHNPDPATRELCRSGALKAIYTWRHPYDAVASAVRMFNQSAEYWMSALRNTLRLWTFHRSTQSACIISYEEIVRAPEETLQAIASHLQLPVERRQLSDIAAMTSLERVKRFSRDIDTLEQGRVVRKDGHTFDRETLLHHNHVRDGRCGYGLDVLSDDQRSAIDRLLCEEGFPELCGAAGTPVRANADHPDC